ncbi:DUF1905 domain-containing protein [Candidatus Dojkabacteria bacterium]|nr:DUF1905 domain-containing protein [Candidatus Dojkabacteria bacterium]
MKKSKKEEKMPTITFKSELFKIGSWTLLRLPKSSSEKLSSRGLAMTEGTINGFRFQTALEPDGKGSHWFKVDKVMREAAKAKVGDTVEVVLEQSRDWSEPKVPLDLKEALASDSKAYATWIDITPFARWEWIRWIRATKNPQTRQKRILVACSKLRSGDRRPCCFNSSQCTVPYVSNNGILMEPTAYSS